MSRVPRIRFKGFEEDWEQRKLGEIFKYEQPQPYIVKCTEYDDINEIPVLTAGQSFILGYTDEEFGIKDVSDENPLIIFDDFTTSSHYVDFPFKVKSSAIKLLTLNTKKDNINCAFNVLQGITYVPISHERHWISIFSSFDVLLPKSNDEQELVGGFFKSLDHLITLHQRKLEKLKIIKKSMLENLFPQNGEKTPKIRFSGFTEDWEQRKLGEIADKVVEKNFQLQERDVFTNSAEFGIIDQKDFFDHEIVNKNNIGGYYIVSPNDFVYNPRISVTAPVGPINRNKLCKRGIMSPLYTVFHPRNMNETFLEFYFRTNKWHKFMEYNGDSGARSDRFSIKTELFYAMTIPFPSHKEQSKIGICFESLDDLITLHQSKLDKLQKIKKSMLESMFV